jgi:5S rRNA maturation endonuclease (ribonuclease M5)
LDDVLEAVGLKKSDLFDGDSVSYKYPDGRVVTRTPDKRFRQSGDRSGRALYGSDKLATDTSIPVYVVEGEQDVDTLATVKAVAVSAAMGATNPDKADWTVLRDRPVVAVVDRDEAGDKWATKIREALTDVASSVTFVHSAEGKDATDHVVSGHGLDEFVPVPKPAPSQGGRRLKIVRASEVTMLKIRWWLASFIAYGALTLLAGPGNTGKSTAAAAWAAEETLRGGTVIYLHSEEGRASQLTPKLKAAGADLDRVIFLDVGVTLADGREADAKLRLPDDLPMLSQLMDDEDVSFVVFDALTSFKPEGASGNSQDDVREFLEPLARLAADRDAVFLGIAHFGKDEHRDARKAVLGSAAWTDVPRSVLAFARDGETGWGVISDVKGNLTAKSRNVEYCIESVPVDLPSGEVTEVGRIVFGNDTDRTADDLRAEARQRREHPDTDGGSPGDWLARFLKNGPQPAVNVYAVGGQAGFSDSQLRRALKPIGEPSKARGEFGGGWWWKLNGQAWKWDMEDDTSSLDTNNRHLLHLPRSEEDDTSEIVTFEDDTVMFAVTSEDVEDDEGDGVWGTGRHLLDQPVDYVPTMLGDEEAAS